MIRRKHRYMVRLSDDEKQKYDALRIRLGCEEWAKFFRKCLKDVYQIEHTQRPITLPEVQHDKSFPLVDLKKKPRNAKTKKPAKKRVKVAVSG